VSKFGVDLLRTKFWILIIIFNIGIGFAQEGMDLRLGDPAPSFYLRSLEGENFFLSKEIKSDSPIILSFYATWCIPCRIEIPALERIMTDTSIQNVRLYYINVGGLIGAEKGDDPVLQREEIDKVRLHKDRFKMTQTILLDRYALTAQKYGADSALPALVVIGGDGKILYQHWGYEVGDEKKLLKLLKSI
jgi:thiol-disulfide isomerase/thioredoxin